MKKFDLFEFSQKEIELITHALHAVAPTGGGSPQFHLANLIANQFDVDVDYPKVGRLQEIAHSELEEYLSPS